MLDATLSGLAASVTFTEAQVNITQQSNRDFDFVTPTILSGVGEDGQVTMGGTTTSFNGAQLTISTSGGIYEQLYISRTRQTVGAQGATDIAVYNFGVAYGGLQIGALDQADGNGVDGNPLIITLNSNATQASIEALIERISFRTLSDNPAASRTITYSLKDSGGVDLFAVNPSITVNITPQNDAPYVAANTGIRVADGATVTIRSENLLVRDEDSGTITFTLTTLPTTGTLRRSGVAVGIGGTFTQADVDGGLMTFQNTVAGVNEIMLGLTASDGTATISLYNEVVNGDMGSATGWTLGAGWGSISGGLANKSADGQGSLLRTDQYLVSGQTYKVTYTLTVTTAGTWTATLGGATGTGRTASGTYTEIITAGATSRDIGFNVATNNSRGTIDNFSIVAINDVTDLGADETTNGDFAAGAGWTTGTGWSIGGGVATKVAGTASNLTESDTTLVPGRTYQVTYTITRTAGTINVDIGGTNGAARVLSGTYTEYITAGTGTTIGFEATNTFAGTVDNFIVKRVLVTPQHMSFATTEVTGGDFASAADWTATGLTVTGGVANQTANTTASVTQTDTSLVAGRLYQVTFTVNRTSGTGTVSAGIGGTAGTATSGSGTFTQLIVAGAGGTIGLNTAGSFRGTIDNFIVRGVPDFANIDNNNSTPTLVPEDVIRRIDPGVYYNASNGNYYRVITTTVSIGDALRLAEDSYLNGVAGHLMTVTSLAENTFIDSINVGSSWMAASDTNLESYWQYMAGPEKGQIFYVGIDGQGGAAVGGAYENWSASEPNDYLFGNTANVNGFVEWTTGTPPGEDWLEWQEGGNWNDNVGPYTYIVEWEGADVINNLLYRYDYTTPATDIVAGSIMGTVQGADQEKTALTYAITAGSGFGLFSVNASTGQITITDATAASTIRTNLGTTPSYTLTMTVSDGVNTSVARTVTIEFNGIPGSGGSVTNNGMTANEAATTTLTTAMLNYTDTDPPDQIIFDITNDVDDGYLQLSTTPGLAIHSFTLADLQGGLVQYVHDGGEPVADSFVFTITDPSATSSALTFNITVNQANDAPTISMAASWTVAQVLAAHPGVSYDATTNSFYRYISVTAGTVNYTQALTAAAAYTLFGRGGSLANITSAYENGILNTLATGALTWLGGSDSIQEGIWKFGGGTESGEIFSSGPFTYLGSYVNWATGEPSGTTAGDDYQVLNAAGTWQDQVFNLGTVDGYIIEWDADIVLPSTIFYTIAENSANGTVVADANSTNPEGGQTVTYSITAGNTGGAFAINSSTGVITVVGPTDFETSPVYNLTIRATDDGGTANGGIDFSEQTLIINLTDVNESPIVTNNGLSANEGATTTITTASLNISDEVPTANRVITITSGVTNGFIALTSAPATPIASFTQANLEANQVIYVHNGTNTLSDTFTFNVTDGTFNVNGNVFSITVNPANDAPQGTNITTAILEDAVYTFATANFGFSDPNDTPSHSFAGIVVSTLPTALMGSLFLNAVAVTAGQVISAANIASGLLTFTPAANLNGAGAASFTFAVRDSGGTANGGVDTDQTPNTFTFNITAVNDAPAGTDTTVTMLEDAASYTFTAANFGFTDPNDTPANTMTNVRITTLPAAGTLFLNAVAVTAGQFITLANINSGLLTFTPAANGNGGPYTTFTFQVQDNGGTANSGVDLDQSANTMSINVTAINDAPAGTNGTVTATEDTAYVFTAANFGFTDPNDPTNGHTLTNVRIASLPAVGSLRLNGVAVTAGQYITVANINSGQLTFTPVANANGTGYASFTFQVQDSGGTANGGVDLDASANTLTIDVTAVNDAPAGADATVTTLEDTSYVFSAANFGFSDAGDSPLNTLNAVRISSLPIVGSLLLNGVAVTVGQFVSAANITSGLLTFAPALNGNGAGYASFTFQVQDNGGTANGGVDLDQSANTITINVTSVNDAPAGTDNTVTTLEDTAFTFTAAHFGFSDTSDTPANTLNAVRITALPATGSLLLNGVAVTAGQFVSVANINSGLLTFTPAANANGAGNASFTFQVQDNGGIASTGVDLDQSANTMTINVTAVNDAPAGTNGTVTATEDAIYTFTAANFGFTDPNDPTAGHTLTNVRISSLPLVGSLLLNGVAVTAGQFITVANINSGLLTFTPVANANGAGYASFTFQVQDSGGTANGGVDLDASANTLTIDVTAVNDAPAGTNNTVTALEDTAFAFTAAHFGFTDPNDPTAGHTLAGVRISTLPATGSLLLNGVAVTAGQLVSVANINSGLLTFTPAANANGAGNASFTFAVQDSGGTAGGGVDEDASPNTMTINVTAVNDAPAGTNNTVTTLEDTAITFTAANFGFTDPNDPTAGHALTAVRISALPALGSLLLNGVAVTAGQVISVANINSGLLTFTPVTNASGTGYTSFTFQVQDTGGTANGGVDLDQSANTMTIDVTNVNDAPAGTNATVTATEDGSYTFTAANFGFTDPNDPTAGHTLTNVRISALPAVGSLLLNGVAVTAGQFITVANINSGLLTFTPAANANGAGYASFTFQVQDSGGTANSGVDLDASPNTMTIDVTAVNDAPAGTNATVTTLEDTAYVFTAANFGFTDPNDPTAGHTLTAVRISALPAVGSLLLNGAAVTAGQVISVANINSGLLTFSPAANANGAGYASFTFQVQDSGGTANGGVDLDQSANTMTINVTSVNDAPAGTDNTVTTLEDTAFTFTTAHFGFSDTSDTPANTLLAVRITALPATGSLLLNGAAVTAGQFISVANINSGLLTFTPAANANGAGNASFTFQVQDNGGTASTGVDLDQSANTMTINVTAVNDAPAGTNNTVTAIEDTAFTFTAAHFGFTDPNDPTAGHTLSAVRIAVLPVTGSLLLNGVAVTAGQTISVANINSGLLTFTPAANANGAGNASFTFQVQDSGGTANSGVDLDASPNTMTIDVTAVNDAPAGTNNTVTTLEDTAFTFTAAHFGFTDPNDPTAGHALTAVRISALPATGSLLLNGVAVTAGQTVSVANINSGLLTFTPAANANGAANASFTFQVQDTGGTANGGVDLDQSANTMTIDVTAVNDAPAGTNNTVTTLEDTAFTFTAAHFGFTDPNDPTAGHTLTAVRISALPAVGSLLLNGVAVTAGQVVSVANINSGLLTFSPAANANGAGYASFTFQVQDTGGTANGGVDLDASANTMTINVTSVNDAPAGTNNTVTTLEDTAFTFTAAHFGFSDTSDTPANTLNAVCITTLPATGSLLLNGAAITAGQFISVANINSGLLTFTPAANANGAGNASFTFQVQDNGGTASGGVDLDQSANTMTINVTAVNDAPAGTNNTVTTLEDTAFTFTAAHFGFTDPNDPTAGHTLTAVRISALPATGSLLLNGVAVTAGQTISLANINSGLLTFTPAANANGAANASFTFQVQDTGGTANGGVDLDQSANTMTIDVTSVNDAPAGANNTITTGENATFTFTAAQFGFSDTSDSPANTLTAVRISSLPALGSLLLNGVAVTAGQFVSVANINSGLLTYTPALNGNGANYANFTFQVQDNGGTTNGGVDLDQSANTMTIDVSSINDAPQGTDATVTVLEDAVYTFAAANFGFSDPLDSPANTLLAVRITTLPAAGSLLLNGAAVTAGQFVSVANINSGLLTFTPVANANGASYASFTFQVQDNGGTAGGGVDLDQSPNTMTVNVTAVNDAPAGTNNTVTTLEDTAFTFTAAHFGFTDPNDPTAGHTLTAVRITALPATGSLLLNGAAVTAGQTVSVANINSGLLTFTPAANANGAANASFTFQVQDTGGTANGGVDLDQSANTMTINVTAVNDAPAGTDNTVTTLEDTAFTFTAAHFGFTDPNDPSAGHTLTAVRIAALPVTGSLLLNGVAVTVGQTISLANINSGLLTFTPAANANGAGNASFTFQVQDTGGTANGGVDLDASANTMTINVTAVNDAPAGTNNTVTALEDTAFTFTAAHFGFTDPNDPTAGHTLSAVRIAALPATGSLLLNGVAVTAGQMISVANINSGLLTFTAAANANGAANASFTFQVQDSGGTANGGVDLDASANTMTIDVTAVNDAPAGTNNTVTTLEDTAFTFTAAHFGFTDPNDAGAGHTLTAVRISALPATGSLLLNGAAVTAGQTISVANINSGLLTFTPAANANGAGNASFTFQVQDTGGTANGGVDLDQSANTMTINVTAVNDAPAGTDNTVTTLEDTAFTFTAAHFGFTDPNDPTAGHTLTAVRITALPATGSLLLNGAAVTAGQTISVANINSGLLTFTPAANANGAGNASFTFQVQDSGGTANGGVDLDQSANTMTINVTAVNDAPAGANNTVTTLEDTAFTFTAAHFGFSDALDSPANTLNAVRISALPATGSLLLNGAAVTAGQFISLANINSGLLTFTPAANANGAGNASFTFQVQDTGGTANGGVDLDQSANTMTIDVTPVNDAPAGTNNTVTTLEDTAFTFTAAQFGFSDTSDSPANTLNAVRITALPATGSLLLNGAAVTAGQFISVANINSGLLTFTPAANANGAANASFTFQVQDNGGTANGGVDLDQSANTMTIDVTPVNDAPAGTSTTVTTLEDTTYTFSTANFGFTDPNDPTAGHALVSVTINALPALGSLRLNGVAVTAGQVISVANIASGLLTYAPPADQNGSGYASFTFQVRDSGGTANGGVDIDPTANTMTIDVTSVDDSPVGTDSTVTLLEDSTYTFTAANFNFSDPNDSPPDNFYSVVVSALPALGALRLNGVAVTAGQEILVTDINAGLMTYTPGLNGNGATYSTFSFQLHDDGSISNGGEVLDVTPNVMTLNVVSVNDAPAGTDNTVTTLEDTAFTFTAAQFGFSDTSDSPANTLNAVRITTLPATGSLLLNGVAVTAGQFVSVANINSGLLTFTPAANTNGAGNASFTFQVQDNGGTTNGGVDLDASANTMTINVTAINDAPAGTNNTITTLEDTSFTFTAAHFGFTDPNDPTAGHTLNAVRITALPATGSLLLNGAAVTAGQFISLANINSGLLTFTPAANANGAGNASFTFQVQDTGGTVGGGVDLDQSPNTMTIDVTAVNDAPAGTNNTVTTLEDTAFTFTTAHFGFTDPNDPTAGHTLNAVLITALPATGSLLLNGAAVTAGQTISLANINSGLLTFTPAANANGAANASFTFQVQDTGGTANGGVDLDQSANTMTINVTAVNDAPAGTDNTVTAIEDTAFTFTTAHFGFTDPNDPTAGHTLTAVRITALPGSGSLLLNGAAVTAGQTISVANINSGLLTFTPAANANGAGNASFTFQVQDSGGTANGGVDLDASANTMTINVTAVNDAPAGTNNTVTTLEDTAFTFTTAHFGFTDPNDPTAGHTLNAVRITALPATGSLLLNGVAVTAGQFVSVANINAGLLTFTPALNANGAANASFTFQVQDSGGTANGGVDLDQSANTMTINVTPVDDAPVLATNAGLTTDEGSTRTIAVANLSATDVDTANASLVFTVTGGLTQGHLELTTGPGTPITSFTQADLVANRVVYVHTSTGTTPDSFTFTVADATSTIGAFTFNVTIAEVNDAPAGTDATVTTLEDAAYTFTAANFGFTDPIDSPANNLLAVRITTIPAGSTLRLNGVLVTAGQTVSVANINAGLLVFTPPANANGAAYASFTFQVQDDGGTANGGVDLDQSANTMTINVTAVNDAPAGTNNTVTTLEDTAFTFTAANFGFTDPNDGGAGHTLSAVRISALPATGSLLLNGAAVTAGQFVTLANINSGLLTFTPAANANGAANASFTFQVQDTGGTANGGVDLDQSANTMTINVTAVNDAPAGTDNTVTAIEDTAFTFTAAHFGFSDTSDSPANTLNAVRITALPGSGSLLLNGAAVTAGQFISLANINSGLLTFTPAANANGAANASFTFQVQDTGGTANGGVDLDQSANTMTINVTAVNDAPAGTNNTVTTLEDTGFTFTAAHFGFTDPNDAASPNTLNAVRISGLPATGSLRLNGVAVTAGQFVTLADINAGLLVFTPAANANGAANASFTFQVQDNGGTANGGVDLDPSANTMTIDVTSVNDAPAGTNATVTALEDTAYTFTTANFGFTDPNDAAAPNSFLSVTISTLPAAGSLLLNGVAVTAGQVVTAADIASGLLTFTGAANANGAGYASFTFAVQDNGGTVNGGVDTDQSPNTMTINVTSVNDAPAGTDNTVTTLEDTAFTFTAAQFGFTDVNDSPANTLSGVRISSLPATGSLLLNGAAVTAGQVISVANINSGLLTFTPAANANGAANASFTFQVQDNGGTTNGGVDLDQSANTMMIDVTSVNDAPAGTNNTVTTLEDTAYTFTAANFGFTDPNDAASPNTLAAVRISGLPAAGSLRLNGVAVTAGQFVTLADINAGLLVFTPAANANGATYASFTFQVQDTGGTANGGVDLDQSANTMTISVTAVNDAPAGTDTAITMGEGGVYTFTTANFGFSDVNDTPANTLSAVTITTLPADGTLLLNGVAVTAGQSVSAANITGGLLTYTPPANATGTNYANFTFQVQDNGGTTNGGVDLDQSANTMTINVVNVNDAPQGANNTVTTLEDTAFVFTTAHFGFTDTNDTPANNLLAVRIT
ncbi:MAG: cadherin-like domain-containing protein, partial [Alphaproteobacteria bacterium]